MIANLSHSGRVQNATNEHFQFENEMLLGLIIAGGFSSRMGENKPTLKVYGETKPDMLDRTASLLQKHLSEVWISCRKQQLSTSLHCIYDQVEGLGPIGGLYSSLNAIKDSKWQSILVLSCDLPFMNEDTICELIRAREKAFMANPNLLMTTYRQQGTGFIESLIAIYEKSALAIFDSAIKAGIRRINQLIPAELRHDIVYKDDNALPFFNINYPADLEKARSIMALPQRREQG